MNVCLVVLNYNDYETTDNFINSILAYETINKIIVVDNCSPDNSYFRLKDKYCAEEKVKVICTESNRGYASGNNFGIRYAIEKFSPKYIVISNPDVFFGEKCIKAMKEELGKFSTIGLVGCKMIIPNENSSISGWPLPKYYTELLTSLTLTNIILGKKLLAYPHGYFDSLTSDVDIVQGCFFMAKTSTLESVDLFCEETFLYCEEQILGYKLKEKGFRSKILNNFSFIHNHGVTVDKNIKSKLAKYKIHQSSKRIYLMNFLKINKFQLIIFDIITYLGLLERLLIIFIGKILHIKY